MHITFTKHRPWGAMLSILAGVLAFCPAHAQSTGTLSGRIATADSGLSLEGVQVSVAGTGLRATSGRGGRYLISGIPTGSRTLRFSYLGLADATAAIDIAAGENVLNIELGGEVFEMEPFLVEGTVIGQARALNFQKTAATLSNIVSADAIGRFPDQNAAEALNRLPGVSVERDQGEGRFVVIRGIDPNLNSVAIDGVKLASPSTGERSTLLDTIPTDTLQRLEVYKSVLPSQPGDSVGGYINIRTPSAFDDDGPIGRIALQSNYSDLTGDWRGKASGAYGTVFNEGTMGLMINASYEERTFGSDNNEADPWEEADGSDGTSGYVSEEFQLREYDLTRQRTGISASLEFKPAADSYYFLRGSWNQYEDTEIRHSGIFELDDFRAISEDSFVADDVAFVREMKDRTEKMKIMAASAGGQNRIGDLTVDYRISYSRAEEDTPFDFETVYEFDDTIGVRFDRTRSGSPRHAQLAGAPLTDPDLYEFDGVELAEQLVKETDWSGDIHFTLETRLNALKSVEFGGLVRSKKKTSDSEVFKEDDNPAAVETLAGFVHASPRDPFRSGLPYVAPAYTRFFYENRDAFALENDEEDSSVEDFESDEDIYAAFLMGNFELSGWQVIAGVRIEHTRFKTAGFELNENAETISPVRGSNDYTHVLPGLHLRRNLSEDMVLRISANQTIARPNFEQTIPNAAIDGDEVEIGNPQLDPLESLNLDASIEYYLRPLGVISAAVFYKNIDNFIYAQTSEADFQDISDAEITTFRNGPSGEILGVELAYQRQLTFLPDALDGFSVYANLTLIDSEATVLGPEEGDPNRDVPFIKQSDWIANLALSYENHGLFARLAYSYRDAYLDEVGDEPFEDRYMTSHGQLDLSASYRVSENLSVFANWTNITDEPLHAEFGESGRLSQYEAYGWSLNAGVKFVF
jgi:TonB-dependent receptor